MQLPMHRALKCRARTRSGQPCQAPAMPNGRCRMHGGMSPGAPKSNKNAYDLYSAEIVAHRRKVATLLRESRKLVRAQRGRMIRLSGLSGLLYPEISLWMPHDCVRIRGFFDLTRSRPERVGSGTGKLAEVTMVQAGSTYRAVQAVSPGP